MVTITARHINEQEFLAALDDILAAVDKNNGGSAEPQEILWILYSMKGDIVRV